MPETLRGRLKLFMGYAAGVGKTYRMLEEAHEWKMLGIDIVVGYFESHGRADTIAKVEGLEIIPRKKISYRDTVFEEMDTDAILARSPQACVVDEFPHTNVPGSARAKRWEDIHVLLDAGIDVLSTMNIQHLESLNDQVWHIAGIRVRETIPDWVVEKADDVVMIDLTPRALLNRLQRGVVYGREKTEHALRNFFREPTLVALRELALRQAAHEVEQRMPSDAVPGGFWASPHRLLVLVTEAPETAMVIRRAKRMADFLEAECFAVAVRCSAGTGAAAGRAQAAVERHLNFARNLHLETRVIEGEDAASMLVDFARRNGITQIFLARPESRSWRPWRRDLVQSIVAQAKDMQVVIVSERVPATGQASSR